MSVKDRILEFCRVKEIKPGRFERECSLSNAYLSKLRHEPSRDKIDNILSTYPELNKEWLLTGKGEMLNPAKNPFSQMTVTEMETISDRVFGEELAKAYERGDIYPAAIYNKVVAEKDKRIEDLQHEVWELQKKLSDLSK